MNDGRARNPVWPVLLCSAAMLLASCSERAAAGAPPKGPSRPVAAEDTVHIKSGSFACISKETLERAVAHAVAGEKSKFEAMFRSIDCIAIPTEIAYKVLHVEGSVLEIVGADSAASNGIWTFRESVLR